MAKKSYNNYDDALFGQYIRQIENADSAGWNASDRIWRAPQRKGLDKRNRCMGVDVLNNLDTKALTKNRPGQYLTEKEEHQLRNEHIQYLLDVINKRKEEDNPALKSMSPKKQAQVLGIMYRGDAPELWKENTILGKALISNKDEDMDKAIKDFYESKGLGERAKNDSIFWNNQKMQNKPKAASVPQTHINNTVEYQDAIKTYKPAIIPSNTVRDTKKAMQDKVDFHNFMDAISIQNNLPPAYTSKSNIHSEGGFMYKPRDAWEALSMPEKAEMMKVAVKNGITNLQDIRQKYNEFAEGGNIYKEGGKKNSSNANPSAQRAMRYFMDKGLTDYQAAGLVGNLMRESGMNPQALNKGSKAYGLAQWLGPRKKALFARYGNNPTLENQLDFIWSELNSTHRNGLRHLRSSRSAEEAARNAMGYYEFSAGPEAAIANMRKYGQDGEGSMRKGISFASNLMGQPIPAYNPRQNEVARLSLQESAVPSEGFIYTPLNPQVFGIADTPSYTINVPDQTLASEPQAEESSVSLYSPEELDRQERMDRLSAFNNMLRMTSPQGGGNVFLDAIGMLTGNAFANGGDIHIKPENRGKFTALKERTGHSATWFKEHGTPAQKKMATFELNSRHWKHGLGGNLFSGEEEGSQQMNIFRRPNGEYFYQASPDSEEISVTPLNTLFDNPALWTYTDNNGKLYTPRQAATHTQGSIIEKEDEGPLVETAKNYLRELQYDINNGVPIGGKYTIPAIAASSLLPIVGNAFAGTTIAGISAPTWTDAALTSGFGAHGLQELANGEADWTTALEIAPLGRLAKPVAIEGLNTLKRGAETVARTNIVDMKNSIGDSYKAIKEGLTGNISTNMGLDSNLQNSYVPYTKDRLKANLKYIFTGQKTGIPGYSNSFAPQIEDVIQQNKGFWNSSPELADANDVIDAFLYGKQIDPRFGVRLVDRGKGFGEHAKYIKDNYASRADNIPVYEIQNEEFIPDELIVNRQPSESGNFGNPRLFSVNKKDNAVDVSGYRLRHGTTDAGVQASQGQDIWKFKPSEYNKKHDQSTNYLKNKALYFGASLFDRLGTPIIFRSKWVPSASNINSSKFNASDYVNPASLDFLKTFLSK